MTDKAQGFTHDKKKNMTVDWWTPKWIFDILGLDFDLDPCAPEGGVPWIPAMLQYSLPQDGLIEPWIGRIWCNPPYGPHTGSWMQRMNEHRNGIALVFARTDTSWFHDSLVHADALVFLRRRIAFVDGLGKTSEGGAGAGSMLAAWSPECVNALRNFEALGHYFVEHKK